MTSSPTFHLLCCELVEDYYGDFYRLIFEVLVSGGRLSAPQVAQRCHLPLRQAKAGLTGLVQLRLANHYTIRESPSIYSANLTNAYNTIRAGRLIALAQERHGRAAGKLIATACELGFATASELRDRCLCSIDRTDFEDVRGLDELIQHLVDNHFLIVQRRAHASDVHDAKKEIELSIISPAALAKLSGTKAKLEHNEAIETRYRQAVDTGYPEHGFVNPTYMFQGKIEFNRANGEVATNDAAARVSILLQPNHHKIVTLSQTLCAQDFAAKTHGKKAAAIFVSAIQQTANPDVWSRHDNNHLHQLDMHKLQQDMQVVLKSLSPAILQNGTSKINGYGPEHHDSEHDVHVGEIERNLLHLKEGPLDCFTNFDSLWNIDKDALDAWTRREETLRVVESRLTAPGPRVLRILIDKGKLEEKTLQELGLLGAKELRQSLSKLKQMGYLDLQEIPRDPHRLPNKTVFLWSYDGPRVGKLILDSVYTSMTRLLQMLRLERKALTGTLEKVEREDVRGREQEMLAPAEYTVLARFRRLEQWTWSEIHRLDSTIAVLRDL